MKKKKKLNKYQVLINGHNFLLDMEGKKKKIGFYTNRYVEASSDKQAAIKARILLQKSRQFQKGVYNNPDDLPTMEVVEVTKLASFDGIENLEQGLAMYSERKKGKKASSLK